MGVHFYLDRNEGEWCAQCAQDEIESHGGNWARFIEDNFI